MYTGLCTRAEAHPAHFYRSAPAFLSLAVVSASSEWLRRSAEPPICTCPIERGQTTVEFSYTNVKPHCSHFRTYTPAFLSLLIVPPFSKRPRRTTEVAPSNVHFPQQLLWNSSFWPKLRTCFFPELSLSPLLTVATWPVIFKRAESVTAGQNDIAWINIRTRRRNFTHLTLCLLGQGICHRRGESTCSRRHFDFAQ